LVVSSDEDEDADENGGAKKNGNGNGEIHMKDVEDKVSPPPPYPR
jgi:hypothetical protein